MGYKYSERLEVNDLISLVWGMKSISITEAEKRTIYAILNNEQKNSNFKYDKFKRLFNLFNKNKNRIRESNASYDFTELLDKGLIELEKLPASSRQNTDYTHNQLSKSYKLTNMGLLNIFKAKLIYSPVRYHNEIVLRDSLYNYFELNTIRSSSAKFFVLISEYLYNISSYLLGYLHTAARPLTSEIQKEIEDNLNLITLDLGFKVAIQFKESNLISATFENNSDKAILAMYEMEASMKRILSRDQKLLSLVSNVFDELSLAREEFLNLRKSN
jgi:hypothetical protein